jgi:hypothetical protein
MTSRLSGDVRAIDGVTSRAGDNAESGAMGIAVINDGKNPLDELPGCQVHARQVSALEFAESSRTPRCCLGSPEAADALGRWQPDADARGQEENFNDYAVNRQ